MATSLIKEQNDQVLFEDKKGVRKIILNRPKQLNCLTYEMFCQMLKKLGDYEEDPNTRLVVFKGNGRAFCAGGDITSLVTLATIGHWSFVASFQRKELNFDYKIATYKKPVVSIIDGIVMGGGAGLSLNSTFRIVSENTDLPSMENALDSLAASGLLDLSSISETIHKFVQEVRLKEDSVYKSGCLRN